MAVMPSDHVIEPAEKFQAAIRAAAALVEQTPGRLVTFGIRPTYPAESFGYIERGEPIDAAQGVYRVSRFREKPKGDLARQYFESGKFYWNSGIFVWRASTILDLLERLQPAMCDHLRAIGAAWATPQFAEVFDREFTAIEGISIDYAVMEHAQDIAVIEAPFSWDDVGSWQAMARLRGQDAQGNTIVGKHLGLRTSGCIVRTSNEHLVATLGLTDCIVVHTPDATLVANKHDEEAVRQLVKLLEERGWSEYL
jgi:mannose-1-phosphate guanylyltransferase